MDTTVTVIKMEDQIKILKSQSAEDQVIDESLYRHKAEEIDANQRKYRKMFYNFRLKISPA